MLYCCFLIFVNSTFLKSSCQASSLLPISTPQPLTLAGLLVIGFAYATNSHLCYFESTPAESTSTTSFERMPLS